MKPPLAACREVKVITVREQSHPAARNFYDSPKRIFDLWRRVIVQSAWYHEDKEHMVCISLDARLRLKSFSLVSMGSLNECIVHPREVFRSAIADSSHSIIIAHNHPSGDPSASNIDLVLTRRIYLGGDLLQIPLLDHVIVAGRSYFSLREHCRSWPPRELRGQHSELGKLLRSELRRKGGHKH